MTKIALVEDNKTIRESLAEFVQTDPENRCVCVCATAEEALKLIPKHAPEIVLMDVQLPKMSGIECCAQLKQLMPSVQIIMVTVYEDTERIFKALRAGACGYILKRCTPEELIMAIREVQQGGAPMSREIAEKLFFRFKNRWPPPPKWKTSHRANGKFWNCWRKALPTRKLPPAWA